MSTDFLYPLRFLRKTRLKELKSADFKNLNVFFFLQSVLMHFLQNAHLSEVVSYLWVNNINILPLFEGVTVDYHKKKKYHPRRLIFLLLVVIYRNTLNQRQYVLYYNKCPAEGGISLQYHPLLWWAGLRKVREKYHIYIYQWNCRIIKEICIKYNIENYSFLAHLA